MRHTMRILIVGLAVCAAPLMAQEWGEVSDEILGLIAIPEDPEADAAILFDKGTIAITLRAELVIQRHTRIKILTERGLKYGDVSISLDSKDEIDNLRAQAILPTGKKIALPKKDIFTKKRDRGSEKVFAIPGIEVGAVIEYAYEITNKDLTFLAPWQFQHREFTKLSELTLIVPEGLDYRAFASNSDVPEPTRESFHVADSQLGTALIGKFTWRAENLPALKPEPYMTTLKDYWATLHFQMVSFKNPNDPLAKTTVFLKTWDDLAEILRKGHKPLLKQSRTLEKQTLAIAPETQDALARARAIYGYVRDSIETSASGSKARSPRDLIRQKKGRSHEKNLLLIAMLNAAELDARPLLISTRGNGRFEVNRPQLHRLNHTIAYLPVADRVYFLDANDKQCPFDLLPPNFLSEKGFLIKEDEGEIVAIPAPKDAATRRSSTRARLTENGELICQTTLEFEGYRGRTERAKLAKKKPRQYVKEMLETRFGEVSVDTFQIARAREVDQPLKVEIDYRIQNYAQVVGAMIYCPSALLHQLQSNPFKREKRYFPVEFGYGFASEETVDLALPQEFEVVELPEAQTVTSLGFRFQSACDADSNGVRFQRAFSVNRVFYTPAQYPRLRNAYAQVASSDRGQLVLHRKPRETNE